MSSYRKSRRQSVFTTDSDNVYFNVQLRAIDGQRYTVPRYEATRSKNIVDKGTDYYLSVIRFTIPSYYLPVLVPIMSADEDDAAAGTTQYVITLEYPPNAPANLEVIVPIGVKWTPDNGSSSWIYHISTFVQAVNETISALYTVATAGLNLNNGAPWIEYDPENKLFSLWADQAEFVNRGNGAFIYFNEYLFQLFTGFQAIRLKNSLNLIPTNDDYRDLQIVVKDRNGSNVVLRGTNKVVMTADYQSLYNWNPYKKLLISTSLLPTNPEAVKGDGNSNSKILTDFVPDNDINDVRSVYQYASQGDYRLIDILADAPITSVDLQIFWQDLDDNIYPVYIPPRAEVDVKLIFTRKSLYNNVWRSGDRDNHVQRQMMKRW